MFVKIKHSFFKSMPYCEIVSFGHAHNDPRFTYLTSRDSILSLSDKGLLNLFNTTKPSEEDIKKAIAKCLKQTGNEYVEIFQGSINDLASLAVSDALKKANQYPRDIEEFIGASNTRLIGYPSMADNYMDGLSEIYGDTLGRAPEGFGYDSQEACAIGAIAVMNGASKIHSGYNKTVVVCAAEKATELANSEIWYEKNLFGHGAGAVVLRQSTKKIESFLFFAAGTHPYDEFKNLIRQRVEDMYFTQEGPAVHKLVNIIIPEKIQNTVKKAGINPKKINHLILHQPSGMTVNFLKENITKMWGNKFRGTIHRDNNVGNTSSASTLLLISKLIDSGEIKPGEIVIVAMFGAGFTWCVYGFVAPQQIN